MDINHGSDCQGLGQLTTQRSTGEIFGVIEIAYLEGSSTISVHIHQDL